MTLREKIQQEIHERGPIPFSRYMEMCLYDPEMGYYSRDVERFGKAGDFYTSSDVHAVFGRLLARQFEEIWRVLGSPGQIEMLELGPGRGLFARDVLDWSEKKFPEFFRALHYSLVEKSTALQRRLQANLERHFIAGKASLAPQGLKPHISGEPCGTTEAVPFANLPAATEKDVTSVVPSGDGPGISPLERHLAREAPVIIFANEFFDALPVEVLSPRGELRIGIRDGRFVETWAPASAEEMEFLDRYSVHPEDGVRVEVPLLAQGYMAEVAAALTQGIIIAVDYGYTREEQLAGRHRGTLMAFRQHSASASPYEAPGDQDITAHVNFTALTAAAEQNGMQAQPLLTQSQFLMGIGEQNQFADAFEDCRLPQETAKVALQLKHLVTPAGMGEAFHVLVCSKGIDPDKVAELSGLSFSKRHGWNLMHRPRPENRPDS
ncbi:MAG TPA: SAM-dependent methyltransferase [Terriglobales bacterium]|nr:SAM-dependent methyltransferase [Terriglobales bacterium]